MKTMQRVLSCVLVALFVSMACFALLPIKSNAASTGNLTFTRSDDGESYEIAFCDSDAKGTLVIPTTFDGMPVTGISKRAFVGCKNLTKIVIPESITSIGYGTFKGCRSLTTIQVDENNKHYKTDSQGVLYSIDGTVMIAVPANISGEYIITAGVTDIADAAFWNCTGLTSVTIPDGVASIGENAFSNCNSLTKVIYCGTDSQWGTIGISDNNDPLTNATRQQHNWQFVSDSQNEGVNVYHCSVCGESKEETIDQQIENTSEESTIPVEVIVVAGIVLVGSVIVCVIVFKKKK